MASQAGLELVRAVIKRVLNSTSWYSSFIKNVDVISASDGQCIAEFTVGDEHLNEGGTLHGGCTSTLIDTVSTHALMTKVVKGRNMGPGVSVDLHVTFLAAAFPGEVVVIDAKTVKAGKNLAFLEVEMKGKSKGNIIARGLHTKFVGERK